ncbi:hypothetical protein ECK5_840 [Escherichia coli O10:K5(L):H4 str. ATCC 23506]|nr:hypothetical protein ECK5_840 [Escherichia coli O10:K5(L):H4 str. ATCC 23506]
MKQKSGKKKSINWRHQIRFWVVLTGYQIEPPGNWQTGRNG